MIVVAGESGDLVNSNVIFNEAVSMAVMDGKPAKKSLKIEAQTTTTLLHINITSKNFRQNTVQGMKQSQFDD